MRNYVDLNNIYYDDKFGSHNIVLESKKIYASNTIKNFYGVTNEYENYSDVYLFENGKLVMTSTEFELLTNKPFLNNAFGDVLIFGLGLGLIVYPLLNDNIINSIKIVELSPNIISYIGNKIKENDINNKVTIFSGDAYNYFNYMNENEKYDTIYFDFWLELNENNINEITTIKDLYSPFLKNEKSFIMSWCDDIKELLIQSMNP